MTVAGLMVIGHGDGLDMECQRQVNGQLLRSTSPCSPRGVPAGEHCCGACCQLPAEIDREWGDTRSFAQGKEWLDPIGRIIVVKTERRNVFGRYSQ